MVLWKEHSVISRLTFISEYPEKYGNIPDNNGGHYRKYPISRGIYMLFWEIPEYLQVFPMSLGNIPADILQIQGIYAHIVRRLANYAE